MFAVAGKGDSSDESRMRRHRADALLKRQVPKPDFSVARSRRQRGQVGRMLRHRLDAVPVAGHAADERLGKHFVHFRGVERSLIFPRGLVGMQIWVVIPLNFV